MRRSVLAATLLILISSGHASEDFQKVYEVPGMSADQIRQAFGEQTIDVGQDAMSTFSDVMDTASGNGWRAGSGNTRTGKLRCNISAANWLGAVNEWKDGEVIFQFKDEKARVTVSNLKVYGPGKKTCVRSIEDHLDARFATLKFLDNDW
jgi:hypothetical protein